MTAISFDEEEKSENDEAAEWTGVRRILWGGGGVLPYTVTLLYNSGGLLGFTGEGGGNLSLPSIKLLSLFRHTKVYIKGSGYPSMQEESKRVVNPGH